MHIPSSNVKSCRSCQKYETQPTYDHVISIKKDCYNSGKNSEINNPPMAIPLDTIPLNTKQ
jgi:hypothetical protein